MATVNYLRHFPFCIWPSKQAFIDELYQPPIPTVYEDFDNTTETIVADLNTIMALYWRVKKWRVSGIFEYYVTSKVSTNYECFFTRDAATEADLVCVDEFEFIKQFTRTGTSIDLGLSSGTAEFVAGLSIFSVGGEGPITNRPVINQGNNLYSAGIVFAASVEEGAPSADEYLFSSVVRASFKTSSPSFPEADPPNTTVPLTFLEQTYNLLANKSEPVITLPNNGGTTTLAISMAIEATEYWPYDPGDGGGPIYDSETGQQLRAFP
jgi:hypothetical protein